MLAAKKCKVPYVLHESNAFPGNSVKLLAKKADKVMVGFSDAKTRLKRKDNVVYTGTPAKFSREDINNFDKDMPTVSISKISNSNPDKKSYKIDANDKTSGIKIIKYDIGNIIGGNISDVYFYSNGIQLKDIVILLDNVVSYINVYVEDNAGNRQILNFEVEYSTNISFLLQNPFKAYNV